MRARCASTMSRLEHVPCRSNAACSESVRSVSSMISFGGRFASQRCMRRLHYPLICALNLIPSYIERAVKDAENVDVPVILHEVCDSVMPIEQNSDVSRRRNVTVPDFRKSREDLRPFVYSFNGAGGGGRVIGGDVLEDVFKPSPALVGPGYCCHERMRCAISSFEMARFASESASPRSTMT